MTHEDEKLLRFWAAGPDHDQYCHVRYEFGYNQPKARREVRKAILELVKIDDLKSYPHTSEEFQDVRRRILKGELPVGELS